LPMAEEGRIRAPAAHVAQFQSSWGAWFAPPSGTVHPHRDADGGGFGEASGNTGEADAEAQQWQGQPPLW
jgi:hypothetical protein